MDEPEPREVPNTLSKPPRMRPLPLSSTLGDRLGTAQPTGDAPAETDSEQLTCQWCAVQLAPGVSVCPTCGSPGVANADLHLPGDERLREETPVVQPKAPDELVEWWRDDELDADGAAGGSVYRNSASAQESDPLMTVAWMAVAVVVCVALGILAAPLLAPLMESITGVEVEDVDDLRPMGGIIGLLVGLCVGAMLGWVVQPRR
jgi:hypothetical protein